MKEAIKQLPIVNKTVGVDPALQHDKQVSFETLAASWFTFDGWDVLFPIIDHDMKIDLHGK